MGINTGLEKKQDKAWETMGKYKIPNLEKVRIANSYREEYKYQYPFIQESNAVKNAFSSKIKNISHFRFATEEEVILANAIYENVKGNFNPNTFIEMFKYTLRLLGVKSEWSE